MRFKGILFDLDNTVYDYHSAHRSALKQLIVWLSAQLSLSEEMVEQAYLNARKQVHAQLAGTASSHSRFLYIQRLCETLGANPCSFVVDAEEVYWNSFFQHMIVRPGFHEFLNYIDGVPIAWVTDLTARIQFQKLLHLGLVSYTKAIVTSEETGREKPHAENFQMALKKLGLQASDVCMVGDDYDKDIVGCRSLNIEAFWLCSDGAVGQKESLPSSKVFKFSSFTQLIGCLE